MNISFGRLRFGNINGMSLVMSWELKPSVDGHIAPEFTNYNQILVQYNTSINVPAKVGAVTIEFGAGWAESVTFFAMDGGEPSDKFRWAFDDGKPREFDERTIVSGSAACQAFLVARKSIKFFNTTEELRVVRLLIGVKANGVDSQPSSEPSYIVPIVRVEVSPSPDFVFEPAIAYYLQPVGAVKTNLPNNGCLSVPVTKVQASYAFGAFVVSASAYAEGLEYSLNGGAKWQPLSQSVVAFGIDACAYLPADLKSVELRNSSGEDVMVAVVVADWVPPFVSSPERRR